MQNLRKYLLTGVFAVGLGGGSFAAYAGKPDCGPKGTSFGEHGKSGERMRERMEKHQAALHDQLNLNANQETAWKAYVARTRLDGPPSRPDRAEFDKLPAPERMEKMLGFMQERQKKLVDQVEATKAFYAVLTPEQKKIFDDEFASKRGSRHHRQHRG